MLNLFQVRIMEQKLAWSAKSDASSAQINRLEGEVEEQRQLRLNDARQVQNSKFSKKNKHLLCFCCR